MGRTGGGSLRNTLLLMVVLIGTAFYFSRSFSPTSPIPPAPATDSSPVPAGTEKIPSSRTASSDTEQHFSPAENLEHLDIEQLDAAQRTIDIAMYAFTDRYLAEKLVRLARRGVQIRLYRDRQQYEEEQRHAGGHGRQSTTDLFRGEANIHVRVKTRHDLMHLKAFVVDARLLRDGSANWSPTGLKRQDNNVHYTADPAQVRAFQQDFEQMWSRPDNEQVQ